MSCNLPLQLLTSLQSASQYSKLSSVSVMPHLGGRLNQTSWGTNCKSALLDFFLLFYMEKNPFPFPGSRPALLYFPFFSFPYSFSFYFSTSLCPSLLSSLPFLSLSHFLLSPLPNLKITRRRHKHTCSRFDIYSGKRVYWAHWIFPQQFVHQSWKLNFSETQTITIQLILTGR